MRDKTQILLEQAYQKVLESNTQTIESQLAGLQEGDQVVVQGTDENKQPVTIVGSFRKKSDSGQWLFFNRAKVNGGETEGYSFPIANITSITKREEPARTNPLRNSYYSKVRGPQSQSAILGGRKF